PVAPGEKRLAVQPEYLTVGEFAKRVSMSRSGVYKLIDRKVIPATRLGNAVRIPASFLDELRAGWQSRPAADAPAGQGGSRPPCRRRRAAREEFRFVPPG